MTVLYVIGSLIVVGALCCGLGEVIWRTLVDTRRKVTIRQFDNSPLWFILDDEDGQPRDRLMYATFDCAAEARMAAVSRGWNPTVKHGNLKGTDR